MYLSLTTWPISSLVLTNLPIFLLNSLPTDFISTLVPFVVLATVISFVGLYITTPSEGVLIFSDLYNNKSAFNGFPLTFVNASTDLDVVTVGFSNSLNLPTTSPGFNLIIPAALAFSSSTVEPYFSVGSFSAFISVMLFSLVIVLSIIEPMFLPASLISYCVPLICVTVLVSKSTCVCSIGFLVIIPFSSATSATFAAFSFPTFTVVSSGSLIIPFAPSTISAPVNKLPAP